MKYISDIKDYCSSDDRMKDIVSKLEQEFLSLYSEMKETGVGMSSKDYTREEIKNCNDDDLIKKLYHNFIDEVKRIYFNDLYDEENIRFIYINRVYFSDGMVIFEYCDARTKKEIDVVLTEDEFFNEDLESSKERFYKEVEIAKRKEKERELITLKNNIERQRDKLNKLISEYENLNNDVHDNEKR